MINTTNPAFDLVRSFKDCSNETEALVMKVLKRKFPDLTSKELHGIFEQGISGEYGKVYSIDPQTLIGWVEKGQSLKKKGSNYLQSPLVDINAMDHLIDWQKEANKCLAAFLNGVSENYFHHLVYARMVLDDKIKLGSLNKYCPWTGQIGWTDDMKQAARKVLRDVFLDYKSRGFTTIYFIQ